MDRPSEKPADEGGDRESGLPACRFAHQPKRLAKNTVYNLLGRVLPMLAGLVAVPFLLKGLGVRRLGVLTLIWLVVGYFGVFDMGIGRATTKFVAALPPGGGGKRLAELIWGSLLLLVILGVVGGGVAAALTPWLVGTALNIPEELRAEARRAFFFLAASMPFVLGTSGARGALEGQHRFGTVNAIRIPGTAFTFCGPLLVIPFSHDLSYIAAVLVCGRGIVFLLSTYFCISSVPGARRPRMMRGETARRLLGFGGWLTVTNIVGALMAFGFVDRFVISSMLDISAVAYYAVPFDAVSKMLVAPAGFVGVLFPVFSAYAVTQAVRISRLHRQALRVILLFVGPAALVLIAFGEPIMVVWLGKDFARESARVLQLVVPGALFCSISLLLASLVQAIGRPDLTAKRHLCELPIYIGVVWLFTKQWGIVGTAAGWLLWQVADQVILFVLLRRLLPDSRRELGVSAKLMAAGGGGALVCAAVLATIPDMAVRGAGTLAALGLFLLLFWRLGLEAEDRARVRSLLRMPVGSPGQSSGGRDR